MTVTVKVLLLIFRADLLGEGWPRALARVLLRAAPVLGLLVVLQVRLRSRATLAYAVHGADASQVASALRTGRMPSGTQC